MSKEELVRLLDELPANTKIYLMNFNNIADYKKEGSLINDYKLEKIESSEGNDFAVISF